MTSIFKYLKELEEDKTRILTSGGISNIEQYKYNIGCLDTIKQIHQYIREKIDGIEDIDDITADD